MTETVTRAERIRMRAMELMGEGVEPFAAAAQAERENPEEAGSSVIEVSIELRPGEREMVPVELKAREMAFLREVCRNGRQLETLLRKLISWSRADYLQHGGRPSPEIPRNVNSPVTLPREEFMAKRGR